MKHEHGPCPRGLARLRLAGGSAVVLLLVAEWAAAQTVATPADTARGWNESHALTLMTRARARRAEPRGDTALRNYSAKAAGHIYFYLDRQDSDERTLVKVDQVALELHWAAPNLTKQIIVGLRDESRLPNKMQYHLDHLTVVQNGFGDIIRLGDGDEVHDVPHPAAPVSDSIYDFRIADSLTLNFPGQPAVRVYEVQVRPKRYERSALIGSIFIDQASADIVRMTFTFTPASYVDRRLDYINISLDNGLWSGRYWLPNEQYVEIRRQIPELDFVAGAMIKGRLRVSDYEFNRTLPPDFFFGPSVQARPQAERERFAFPEELFAGLDREGLSSPPQVEVLRAQALELIRQRRLSGLPPFRMHIANASSVLRYNRAEGWQLGMGARYLPGGAWRYEGRVGLALAAQQPNASLAARMTASSTQIGARAFFRELRDLGWRPGMPGALNSLTASFGADDYLDPFYATGAELELARPLASGRVRLLATLEQHRSAQLEVADAAFGGALFRPVRPIDNGSWASFTASWNGALLSRERVNLNAAASLETGLRSGDTFLRPMGSLGLEYGSASRATTAWLRMHGGLLSGNAPPQKLFLLGGRGTLPGYHYRDLTGDRFWLVESEATHQVLGPWVRVRALAAYGGVRPFEPLPPAWPTSRRSGVSMGLGVGLIYDIIRLDLVRGGSNSPRLLFSVRPDFWDMM